MSRPDPLLHAHVMYGTEDYLIEAVLEDYFVIRPVDGGEPKVVKPATVVFVKSEPTAQPAPRPDRKPEEWALAEAQLEVLQPIMDERLYGTRAVKNLAERLGVSPSTIYRRMRRSNKLGSLLTGQLRQQRSDRGESRLSEEVEEVVQRIIKTHFLSPDGYSPKHVVTMIQDELSTKGLGSVSRSTLYKRIESIPERERIEKRLGKAYAQSRHGLIRGGEARERIPLGKVEIDHYELPISLRDDSGEDVGRVWLTLALDAGTRMVLSWYLSLDPPDITAVAICLARLVYPKADWLRELNLDYEWPCYGLPKEIRLDNAKEFRSAAVRQGLAEFGVKLSFRKPYQPRTGGQHVERFFKTLQMELPPELTRKIKPTDPKSPRKARKAAEIGLAFEEFERWLAHLILGEYHKRLHQSLNRSPLEAWKQWFDPHPGVDLEVPDFDMDHFIKMFLPFEERTVQRTGILLDYIYYRSPELDPYVNIHEPGSRKKKLKLRVRVDPRDITKVFVQLPNSSDFITVPNADRALDPTPRWLWRALLKETKQQHKSQLRYEDIVAARQEREKILENARNKTRLEQNLEGANKLEPTKRSKKVVQPKKAKPLKTEGVKPDDDDQVEFY